MRKVVAIVLDGAMALLLSAGAMAQMRELPAEGLEAEGISKDVARYEPENEFRRANGLGQTAPAPKGTKPGSLDPRNISGVWVVGPTYRINADGTYTNVELAGAQRRGGGGAGDAAGPGGPGGPGAGPAGSARGTGDGSRPGIGNQGRFACRLASPFGFGMPERIMQAGNVIYILTDGQRASNRRIVLNGHHPADLAPSYTGDSIAHWEGNWLVIQTTGLKGSYSAGMFGAGSVTFTPATSVTERMRKIEGNMTLETLIKVEDPALAKPIEQRFTAYYRPDLDVHEAPCEEYDDPFEGNYATGQFEGNSSGPDGVPTAADAERLKEIQQKMKSTGAGK